MPTMARQPRLRIAGLPLHVVQRGVNREDIFLRKRDHQVYLSLLAELAPRHGCGVHAYVLMTNHVHLLLTPNAADDASVMMKHLGQRYAQYANATHERTGGLFEDRFRSSIVDSERYFLTCQRYIEMNPVRAGMVAFPGQYAWSSYRANAEGRRCDWLTPHQVYLALGTQPEARRASYRRLLEEAMAEPELDRIRESLKSGLVLGSDEFIDEFERSFGRKGRNRRRGRKPAAGGEMGSVPN